MTLTPATLCMKVIAVNKSAVYLRLPAELQRDIEGGCSCEQCRKDPKLAKWDTLVAPITVGYNNQQAWSHTVHMPDESIAAFLRYCKANNL